MMDAGELPDLDFLLDAAENGSGDATGDGADSSDKGPFDPNEYADVVQWYNERTQNIQRHYDTHLEYQKQKLAEENEAGLLEALKQSLDNIESDHMSDFANISSLGLPYASTSITETPLSSDCEFSEEPSMLKKLLLSPTNGDYPKEVDSPNSSDHGSSLVGDPVKVKKSSPSQSIQLDHDGGRRRKFTKTKKPFTELIKHMVTTENRGSSGPGSKNCTTKFINTKRYMQKYGTTPCSTESALPHNSGSKTGRDVAKTPASKVTSTVTAASTPLKILTSVSNFLSACNGNSSLKAGPSSNKQTTTVLVKPVPQKGVSPGSKPKGSSKSPDMLDHDYCAESSTNLVLATIDATTTANTANYSVPGNGGSATREEMEHKLPTKVLKWEDYLHRVRAGIRSAPNSPTCTPKVMVSRPVNNFMVVSTQKVQKLLGKCESAPHTVQKRKGSVNAETKKVKLQGFEEYMSALKNNMIVSSGSSAAPVVLQGAMPVSTPARSVTSTTSATNVLASMIQQKKCEELQKSKGLSVKMDTESTESNMLRLRTNITSAKEGRNGKAMPACGSSGQMLMIHVPAVSQAVATPMVQKTQSKAVVGISGSSVDIGPTATSLASGHGLTDNTPTNSGSSSPTDPRLDASRIQTSNRPVKDLKIPAMMRLQQCSNEKKALESPTFKLVTSGKQGVQAKSLILSGVTGQLKQILTSLAKQQAEKKDVGETSASSSNKVKEDQETTLQKLLAVINSLNTLPSGKAPNARVPDKNSAKAAATSDDPSTVTSKHCLKHEVCGEIASNAVSAQNSPVQVHADVSKPTAHTPTVVQKSEQTPVMCDQPFPRLNQASDAGDLHPSSKEKSQDVISSSVRRASPQPVEFIATASEPLKNGDNQNVAFDINGNHLEPCDEFAMVQSAPDSIENRRYSLQGCEAVQGASGNGQQDHMPVKSKEVIPGAFVPGHSAGDGFLPTEADRGCVQSVDPGRNHKPKKVDAPAVQFSMVRSMAAAEMLATDVVDGPVGEILVYDEAEIKSAHKRKVRHPDSPVPTADESSTVNGISSPGRPNCSTLSEADQLFCKLPSYFLNGKLAPGADQPGQTEDRLDTGGLKNADCDPLINAPVNDEIGYNKLPHYFSSGKSVHCGSGLERVPSRREEPAVKFTTLYKNKHITAEGAPVDESETYYSRLPTYYSYGRPYPAVKTFNDAVADDNDDTVTLDLLDSMEFETLNEGDDDEKPVVKRKPKRKRRRKHRKSISSSDKLLYSKLPSYYMSSRPAAKRRKFSRSRSPSPSLSSSSDSLYHSSGSCSPRSSEYRSGEEYYSRKRRRSRSRRTRSYKKSCTSSTGDRWGRERSCFRERFRGEEANDKRRLRAMEERRVVYVGRIDRSMTESELRLKFIRFGNIEKVSLHFRDDGDNYGFVTFQYTCDAFRAIEEGNADLGPDEKQFDLCFGGRREFCKTAYEDLDSKLSSPEPQRGDVDDFDALLQQAKRSIRR